MTDRRVEIVQLDARTLAALADGDLNRARLSSGLPLTPFLVSVRCRGTWAYRVGQVRADPAAGAWVTGVVRELGTGQVVGQAGFHGPPDASGLVEVGYAIDPARRRQGFGRAVLTALLARAAREVDVRVVRASISPNNAASLALAEPFGFVLVGEQWDEEDGLELVFEVAADRS
ncbi:MAG: hypothetical protein JWP61_949 [Friedmanniella sp.]|nr:hypothetical protein [Friedmanniella sp.]